MIEAAEQVAEQVEVEVEERRQKERRQAPKSNGAEMNIKWIMGIVATLITGVFFGWYSMVNSDLRDIRPDVAVLKVEIRNLNEKVAETNQKLAALAAVLEQLRNDQNRREVQGRQ